jgi:uncharacterized membrane protein
MLSDRTRTTALRSLSDILVLIIAYALILGGPNVRPGYIKIPTSSVDVWALLLALVLTCAPSLSKVDFADFGLVSRLFRLFENLMQNPRQAKIVGTIIFLFVFLGSLVAHIFRHWSLFTDGFDVSFVHQPLFFPFRGNILHADACPGGEALGCHLTFTFLLLAPVTAIFKSDEVIFVIQILLMATAIWYSFSWSPAKDSPKLYLPIIIIVLCHKALRNSLVWDFREDVLAFVALFAMYGALRSRKLLLFFVFLLMAIASKEQVFLVTLCFSIAIGFATDLPLTRRERLWIASVGMVVSVIYGIVAFKYLIPGLSGDFQASHPITLRYRALGGSPTQILANMIAHPLTAAGVLLPSALSYSAAKYVVWLIVPFAYFYRSRAALVWLIPAVPGIMMNITNELEQHRMLSFHYELVILPFLIVAAYRGMEKVHDNKTWAIGILIALCFSGRWPSFWLRTNFPSADNYQSHIFLKHIPNDPARPLMINFELSAQVNHVEHLQFLRCDSTAQGTMTAGALEAMFDTKRVVLDLRDRCESRIYSTLSADSKLAETRSENGRLVLIQF